MGIFDALTTAVSGLQAQAFALQNISGNISNSQTTGYKGIDTSFADLVNSATLNQQSTEGVIASSVSTNTVGGPVEATQVSTNMAIQGDGFFVVAKPTGFSDNQPTFNNVDYYTRAGDFQLNSSGYLVNGAGYYLMGIPVNAATGNPEGSVPTVLQFDNNFVPAQSTTTLNYQANLPSAPKSGMLDPNSFEANPLAGAPIAAEIDGVNASLIPDSPATGIGTIDSLSSSTTLASLNINSGDTISIGDGTNTTTYTATGSDTVGDLITAINGGSAAVTASLNSSGNLVLTGNNDVDAITVAGTGASDIGFGAGENSFNPTNLLTQSAVAQGQTMTVVVEAPGTSTGTVQTITFGTGAGQVETLAQLQTAVQGLSGVTGTLNTLNGDLTLTATNPTDSITVGGTASATKFGIENLSALPANGTVIANDVSNFDNQSIDGGSVTAYDADGNPVNVQLRWAQVSNNSGGSTWQLFYQSNSDATGTQPAWQNTGTTFNFNSSGELTPPITSMTLQNLTVNGDSLGNVQLQLGSNGLTQFANPSGTAQVNQFTQNGFAAGQLESVAVDSQDRVTGTFSNGQTIPLAEVTLATFGGENSLQALNGGAYAATPESGAPSFDATGQIVGSSLEGSNVDIATQFSQLIVAQQAYSANAKVMSTADQMIQSLLQVVQ
jgi:flagellar hook protein FlgE